MALTPKSDLSEEELQHIEGVINPSFMHEMRQLINFGYRSNILNAIKNLHEADVAELITVLSHEHRSIFMDLVGPKLPAAVFAELDDHIRREIVEHVDINKLVMTVQELDSDDAVFVLEDLAVAEQKEVLEKIPALNRASIERALEFPEQSAGRLAQAEFVAVPPYWTVGQTIDHLRSSHEFIFDFHDILLVDPRNSPNGIVHLSKLLRSQRNIKMESLTDDDLTVIDASTDREDVARLFERYHLFSAPVVDGRGWLIGVITADDVFDVINEEAGEDILLLGGIGDEKITDTVIQAASSRFSWLLLNLFTAILASLVIGLFDASLDQMVALAILMPIVASMGGNAGTQTLTITIRSLSTQEISRLNYLRTIFHELGIGIINGILFAAITGLVGAFWFSNLSLGLVLAVAMILNLIVASLAGILIPLGLDRAGIDPAVASSVFVTTVTDVVGFLAFLGFATLFLLN